MWNQRMSRLGRASEGASGDASVCLTAGRQGLAARPNQTGAES
jgi:hypothetical protein